MATCPSCDHENPDEQKFCGECGAKLEATPVREERKVITALFCDLVGSTALGERLDAEDISRLLRAYQSICRQRIESHGGVVEKFIGDAVVGVFGVPLAHEDDPERAVIAALRIIEGVGASDLGIEVRIGVNTGEALVRLDVDSRSGEGFATGDTMNTAARLEAAAPVMGVAVGEATHRASAEAIVYEELPAISAKGKAEPVQAWRALHPTARIGTEERDRTPFVGRDLELSMLTQLFERARSRPATEFVTIVAEPGLGKSRLVRELARHVDRLSEPVTWREGRCLPYGDGISFWALGEIVKAQAGILETDDQPTISSKLDQALTEPDPQTRTWIKDRLAPLVGLETTTEPPQREEAFTAWRRFLEQIAAGPTVLVIEDLHWADDAFVAFLEHLAERTAGLPLLVVVTARPEVEERHPSWPPGRRSTVLSLSPLSDADLETLVAQSFPEADPELISVVLQRAGGSPLYAEQLAAMLRERMLPISGEALDETLIPSSVQALIAARIDALPVEPKQVLMEASVVGKSFWAGSISALGEHADLEATLGELVRREFCRPVHPSTMEGDLEFSFWHALVRDVAYAELTKAERARMHELVADWLEGGAGGVVHEHQEFVAYHLQTALEHLGKENHPDDRTMALTSRAATAMATAGRRSFARGDMVGARKLLGGGSRSGLRMTCADWNWSRN
jgi:class 3 adenylate cyclase